MPLGDLSRCSKCEVSYLDTSSARQAAVGGISTEGLAVRALRLKLRGNVRSFTPLQILTTISAVAHAASRTIRDKSAHVLTDDIHRH